MRIKSSREGTVIFIVGPTAIGKTRLSVKLASKIHGEIISCDSMQVYKGMDILSQAPGKSERKEVRHHLAGVLDPREEYSVADFRKKAVRIIAAIIRRGKVPIVAGGSGLYVKALIDGLFPSPPADVKFRNSMRKFISKYGVNRLHERLLKIDPEAAAKIHPNDARRIIRALEIYDSTGRTMTELKLATKGLEGTYAIRMYGLTRPRDQIYEGIESRTERMFGGPVLKEVGKLKKKKLSKTAEAVLGFREISEYLDGKRDLESAKSVMKRNTRRFAKRQLTWFGSDGRIRWFDLSRVSEREVINRIVRQVI